MILVLGSIAFVAVIMCVAGGFYTLSRGTDDAVEASRFRRTVDLLLEQDTASFHASEHEKDQIFELTLTGMELDVAREKILRPDLVRARADFRRADDRAKHSHYVAGFCLICAALFVALFIMTMMNVSSR